MSHRRRFRATIATHLVFGSSVLFAQSGISPATIERAGQSGWQFLKINGDARQAAMGGAFTVISRGDANGVFGNPATLADVVGFNVQVNAVQWVADIGHRSVALAGQIGDVGVVALSAAMLDYGDIPETVNRQVDGGFTAPFVTGSMYSASDLAVGVTFARAITSQLSLGGSVRWLRQSIAELSMTNWALDLGTMYHTGFRSLRLAIAARNFGPDSRLGGWSNEYQSESDNVRMPFDFRAGLAMDLLDSEGSPHLVTVALEGDHPNDGREKIHVGVSYGYDQMLFLRAGYRFNYDVQRYTFGGGVRTRLGGVLATLDYAYVDFGLLTKVHMISMGLSY